MKKIKPVYLFEIYGKILIAIVQHFPFFSVVYYHFTFKMSQLGKLVNHARHRTYCHLYNKSNSKSKH